VRDEMLKEVAGIAATTASSVGRASRESI